MNPAYFWVLAVALLSQGLPFLAQQQSKEAKATCPANFLCGNMSLTFPFADLSHYNCGLCTVDCGSNKSFPKVALNYLSEPWFIAKAIGSSTISLHDEYLQTLLSRESCKAFSYASSLLYYPSISFTFPNNITLLKCSNNSDSRQRLKRDSFPGFGYYGGCSDIIYYSKTPNSSLPDPKSIPMCSLVFLPYNKSSISDQSNKSGDDVSEVFHLLSSDYDLQWHVTKQCEECHRRGGFCPTDVSKKEPQCVNADGNSFSTGKKKLPLILGLVGAAFATAFLLFGFVTFLIRRRIQGFKGLYLCSKNISNQSKLDLEALARQCGSLAPKCYSYSDIKKMTNSFKYELGKGGYGAVFKGKLLDGHLVAVKLLNSANENEQDFINEVLSISKTSHVNVVKLLGFCIEEKKRALVYEYMANGSLEKYIHGPNNESIFQLSIEKLYKICLGVARGLEYLHRGCNTRILHFDIKPHNILLNEDFHPKISDFGLSKQYSTNKESVVSSFLAARGTIGYIAPELISRCFGVVSHKSDVYSFGMMILEIVGRRKNVIQGASHGSEVFFPHWAYQHLIIDKDLRLKGINVNGREEDEIAKKIILVGLWCIQKYPSHRPPMNKVIEMLEGNLEAIEIPPKPFFDNSPSSSPLSSFYHDDFVSERSTTL